MSAKGRPERELLPLGGKARSAKGAPVSTALLRGAGFAALWLILIQSVKPADLIVGAFASVAAAWVSLRLLPPASGSVRFVALLALVPHFLWESVLAGVDVARRAFDPRLPLRPGFLDCPLDFPPGFARNTFTTISSLLPGSVPAGESDGGEAVVYHCLDTAQPVAESLREEERLFARALVAGQPHD